MLFNKAKGVTDPGLIPSNSKRCSFFANDTLPSSNDFEIVFRLILLNSSHENKIKFIFFIFYK